MKSERMFHQFYALGSWLQQLITVDEIETVRISCLVSVVKSVYIMIQMSKISVQNVITNWILSNTNGKGKKKVKSDDTLEQ
jgi:hypothetical protein